jgi:hypothetical protein
MSTARSKPAYAVPTTRFSRHCTSGVEQVTGHASSMRIIQVGIFTGPSRPGQKFWGRSRFLTNASHSPNTEVRTRERFSLAHSHDCASS